ncbi:uncharacterized protein J4E92_005248 [Alternaria infectoria]|uniref:uncharacterized protein n=1 Tax=Alternaria infectoria TaxID=45303 RepID=UPI002220BE00|nr:uncharacterized protein J4E92_005248 [Alternaria infectoria]KAI4929583.1 hypothetical protein J4E92_005248 [Alternaria infectoria]
MTTRNLNGNWIDTLRRQYVYDLKDDSPHPIKYLLYNPHKKQDLYFVIPNKIEEPQLRRSLVKYHLSTKANMKFTLATALLLLAPALIKAWKFEVFEEDCITSTDFNEGDDDVECEDTAEPHGCFRISEMGSCEIFFHADADECEDGEVTMSYTATDQDRDIQPDFEWNNWSVQC